MSETFIITRPEEDAQHFMQAARAAGHAVIAAPLLSIHFRDDAEIPPLPWQAVAITSANGARAIARRKDRAQIVRARAVTVGPASAQAAREAGFADILRADGDVRTVIAAIRAHLNPRNGPILYASGAVTRGDLTRALGRDGFEVVRAVLYEAVAADALSPPARAALGGGERGTVALYSPRTAKIWARLVRAAGLRDAALRWRHACLSENVAGALRESLGGQVRVMVAPAPHEEAMLRMLNLGGE